MNKEQTKAAAEVMVAHANGATIEGKMKSSTHWQLLETPKWDWDCFIYRVKPQPKLRPWRPEEIPVGALVRYKQEPTKIRLIISNMDKDIIGCGGTCDSLLQYMEHSLDHGATWKPCGVYDDNP